jgi:hypothetical protein
MTNRANITVEVSGVKETEAGLDTVAGGLAPSGAPMRAATAEASRRLGTALAAAAHSAPTPQAALVAASIRPGPDGVAIGGDLRVGHRGTPARELVEGSEHGGKNFAAPHSAGGYWITPTKAKERTGKTKDAIQGGVDSAIRSGGF